MSRTPGIDANALRLAEAAEQLARQRVVAATQPVAATTQPVAATTQPVAATTQPVAATTQPAIVTTHHGPQVRPKKPARITGIDMARGLAMFAMTVVHFVNFRENEGETLATLASHFRGRAMPLFVMLGGIGVTYLTRRSKTPERDLIIRAIMLFALGLVLTEYVDRLAIILQSYGLFFILATVLWRLPSKVLLALVPAIVATGAVTYQLVGTPRRLTPFDEAFTVAGAESLIFDGFYPLFPVGAFFVFGIWLGRINLASERVAAVLAGVGTVVGIGTTVIANAAVERFNLQIVFGRGRAGDGMFHLTRLLDSEGHSAMPAWVISALGTSAAVLGISLLLAPRFPRLVRPVVAVGSTALTYYVYQAWLTNVVPPTFETSLGTEWIFTFAVYASFVVLALIWKVFFDSGPFERALRIGSGPKKAAPTSR